MEPEIENIDVLPWSTTRSESPPRLPSEMADKNVRIVNPLSVPDIYYEFYDRAAESVRISDPVSETSEIYELVENLNDPESGYHAKIIRNPETAHYIILNKGMDMPLRDEGAGSFGFAQDISDLKASSLQTCISDQVIAAEEAFLSVLQDPEVQSLEVVGYSIGAIPANYQAAVYGAKVTNIADLGVPGSVEESTQNLLASTFNWCSNGFFPGTHGEFGENLNNNIIGLKMRADVMGGGFGGVGQEFGRQIVLDEETLEIKGLAHVPEVYAQTVRENFPQTPEAETVTSRSFEKNWTP